MRIFSPSVFCAQRREERERGDAGQKSLGCIDRALIVIMQKSLLCAKASPMGGVHIVQWVKNGVHEVYDMCRVVKTSRAMHCYYRDTAISRTIFFRAAKKWEHDCEKCAV